MNKKVKLLQYCVIVILVLVLGVILGYHQITPTQAPKNYKREIIKLQDTTEGKSNFSMVMSHDYRISKESHPSGSAAIEQVREYLLQQFEAIGCNYQRQDFTINMKPYIDQEIKDYNAYMEENPKEKEAYEEYLAKEGYSSYEAQYRAKIGCIDKEFIDFTNFIVKLDAPDTDQAILFVSHYDSVSAGPGAGDDAISAAAMLEALRVQYQKGGYTNDIYFLFTDGEELELFGAEAFVSKYTELKEDIKLVFNLEARGNSGTLIMFETSLYNKNVVKELNKALTYNSMFSMTAAVYRVMPNDTDLTKFLEAGYTGTNFSVIGNPENYHAITDSHDNLDLDSAYMYYTSALELADYFGKSDLTILESKEDAVYFPFLKGNTVIISNQLAFILSCALGVLSILWLCFLAIKRVYKISQLILHTLGQLLLLLSAVALAFVGSIIYGIAFQSGDWYTMADTLDLIFYAFCLLSVIITMSWIWRRARKEKNIPILLPSTILLYNILNWICTLVFNSLAYIFTVPLLFLFLNSVVSYYCKGKVIAKPVVYFYLLLQGIILCLLYVPCIYLLYTALLSDVFAAAFPLTVLSVIPTAVLSTVMLNLGHRQTEIVIEAEELAS